jgi:hypothetical protein
VFSSSRDGICLHNLSHIPDSFLILKNISLMIKLANEARLKINKNNMGRRKLKKKKINPIPGVKQKCNKYILVWYFFVNR